MKIELIKPSKCKNCGTQRYNQVAKGLCSRCYPLTRMFEQIERCDLSKPKTLKSLPSFIRSMIRTQKHLDAFKIDTREQIRQRLEELKVEEAKLRGAIYGIDIEYLLRRISWRVSLRAKNLYFGVASVIDHNFSMKQKSVLFGLLHQMEEKIPWEGIRYGQNLQKVADDEYRTRSRGRR